MSKNQNNEQNLLIEKHLTNISSEIVKLGKTTKLKDILKKHNNIKEEINIVSDKLNEIKTLFDSSEIIENTNEIITDENFELFSKDINDFLDLDCDNIGIKDFVTQYSVVIKKIHDCEQYLKSKKMELIDCDKNL